VGRASPQDLPETAEERQLKPKCRSIMAFLLFLARERIPGLDERANKNPFRCLNAAHSSL